MIELAPNHKIGLTLSSPVLIASGFCGYGTAYRPYLDQSRFGAMVTQPVTLRPEHAPPQPRIVETDSGIVINIGYQNPGVKRVLRDNLPSWTNLECKIIVHLPAQEPNDLRRTAQAVSSVSNQHDMIIAAIEFGLPNDPDPFDVGHWLRALQEGAELPLLVKLPFNASYEVIEAVMNGAVEALVVGFPPLAQAGDSYTGRPLTGHLYGPLLHSLNLAQTQRLLQIAGDIPIIASGGIYSLADAKAYLDMGAAAIQIDALMFLDPDLAVTIGSALSL